MIRKQVIFCRSQCCVHSMLKNTNTECEHPDENMKQYVLHCQTCWKYPLVGEFTWQFIQLLSWQEEGNGDISNWLKKIQNSSSYLSSHNEIIEILAFKSVSILVGFFLLHY